MSNTSYPATRRTFWKYVAATAAMTLSFENDLPIVQAQSQRRADGGKSKGVNVLLVHGAYVDASSWLGVITLLQAQGYNALAVQLPLVSLEDDITITRQALASLSGPTILVGHSYAGAIITNVGTGAANVRGLVFADAFSPEEGESIVDIAGRFPTPPINAFVVPAPRSGFVWVEPSAFPENFIQDVPIEQSRALAIVQKPINPAAFRTPSGPPAWKTIPSWVLIGTNDRAIHPDAQRFMARRIGAKTREVASSHASPVSHPQDVFDLIVAAATSASAIEKQG